MRALGVDYGDRRIGFAVSDATGTLARPWKTVPRTGNPQQVARAISAIVAELDASDDPVSTVVLGLPKRLSGEPNEQTAKVLAVADGLRPLVSVPVVLQDERLTSREAEEVLARREKDWRKRKQMIDAMAAALILQDYLDIRGSSAPAQEDGQS